ncbi:hypothetical protein FSP39_007037 [Pinctada imbricata]|uniref:Phorbol-ester/DAG-type domain-containing protein n=1 Tax=Pinctada imbricata TaxID=66713 RepID=A0AA88XCW2_PINIB|nr:hypothetical protein FSP39_007037 [Pinctada imbricata]
MTMVKNPKDTRRQYVVVTPIPQRSSVTEGVKCGLRDLIAIMWTPFTCCKKRKDEPKVIPHRFAHYYFHKPRTCFLCKQKVLTQGSACQVCRFICHRQCESKDRAVPSCHLEPGCNKWNKPQMGHPLADMQFRKRDGNSKDKKQSSFAKSGKKSLQGISRFLLGDSNKKNKQDSGDEIEMDNLHRDSVENSHAIISDYLKSVEKPADSDQHARTSTNQVHDTSISTNRKKGSKYKSSETESKTKRSSPWSLHKVIHHFQNRKDNQGQGPPPEQRKLDLKGEKHEIDPGGEDYYDNQDTSGSGRDQFTPGRTEKIDVVHSPPKPSQSSKFVFSPIYSSTPKKKDMEKPKNVKNLSVNDEKRRYEGNAIPIASTWEQRPFSSDYEEIRTTDNSSLSQVTQNVIEQTSVPQSKSASGGNVSHDSDVTAKHSQSHFRKRKRTYPGLNLSPYRDASKFDIARPVPQHSRSAQHSQKEGVYSKIKHSPPPAASRDLEIDTSSGQTRDGKVQKSKVSKSVNKQALKLHGYLATGLMRK